jgi:PIN domain nuclease of toxin-antitoxin system
VNGGLIVDTHILLWARTEPERLTAGEQNILLSAHIRYVSVVCLWEFTILMGLGRIETNKRLLDVPSGYDLLPISPDHCKAVLDLSRHHRDPFDRMLIAQAKSEGVPLLTRDRRVAAYSAEATILRFPEP